MVKQFIEEYYTYEMIILAKQVILLILYELKQIDISVIVPIYNEEQISESMT